MSRKESVYVDDWDKFVDRGRYGGWDEKRYTPSKVEVIVPESLSFSDYSGSTAERSNNRVWEREFGDSKEEIWTNVLGGHGTVAVAIRADKITPEMEEFLDALKDYPIADDDDHSELEMELQQEAWDRWARDDFKKLLVKDVVAEAEHQFEDADARLVEDTVDEAMDGLSDDVLYDIFHEATDTGNQYWESQTGGDMYINLARVVENVDAGAVLDLLVEKKLLDPTLLMDEDAAARWRAARDPRQTKLALNKKRKRTSRRRR